MRIVWAEELSRHCPDLNIYYICENIQDTIYHQLYLDILNQQSIIRWRPLMSATFIIIIYFYFFKFYIFFIFVFLIFINLFSLVFLLLKNTWRLGCTILPLKSTKVGLIACKSENINSWKLKYIVSTKMKVVFLIFNKLSQKKTQDE